MVGVLSWSTIRGGIPLPVHGPWADLWRLANFAVSAGLLGWWGTALAARVFGRPTVPAWTLWGQAALAVAVLRSVVAQLERWHSAVVLEGAPTFSLVLGLAVANVVAVTRATRTRR